MDNNKMSNRGDKGITKKHHLKEKLFYPVFDIYFLYSVLIVDWNVIATFPHFIGVIFSI